MAIFTAGCIESTQNIQKIRNSIYELAKHDLDSPAMRISVRKTPTCINYIAFLPKDKMLRENILKTVSRCDDRTVVIFELDYKHVGIICESQRIEDYILDRPEEFAQERGYETRFADNVDGVKLVSFNLDKNGREAQAGWVSLGFTILLTTVLFYSGYHYMKDIPINKGNQDSLSQQYKRIVKKEFSRSEKLTRKVDMVKMLEDIERLTKATQATLQQVKYDKQDFCVEVKTAQIETFVAMLPENAKIKHRNSASGIVQYCYEKI